DAGVPPVAEFRPGTGIALDERLDHSQGVLAGSARRAELADRLMQRGGEGPAQGLVRSRLELAGAPPGAHRRGPQGAEEDGLAHPAQTREDDGPFRPPTRHPFQHDVEGVELLVPAGELGRTLAGAGRIRVANRIHDRRLYASLATTAYIAIGGYGVSPGTRAPRGT